MFPTNRTTYANFRQPTGLLWTCAIGVALLLSPAAADDRDTHQRNWPAWRGPLATGAAPHADPPVEWSESENVRWKTPLPGKGHSTPIVWNHRVFVTTAVPVGDMLEPKYSGAPGAHDNVPVTHRHDFVVMALSRRDGTIDWQKALSEELPHEGGHYTGSLASFSPVTDGEHLFAYFGSRGLFCLTLDGEVVWKKDLGDMQTKHGHGEGSSPALYGDTLVVNWDHEGESFAAAFDKRTGKQRWKVARTEVTSWATPIVVEHAGRPQVIISGTDRVRGYDLETGEIIWECGGMSANIVASPVFSDGIVYAGSSYEKRALLAIQLEDAAGDITGSNHVIWDRARGTPYVPSPLLYDDALYFLAHYQGILTRVDARTGKDQPGPMRLGAIRNVYASPVAANGRLYVTDLNGTTMVITSDDTPEVLAVNRLNDSFSASAAISGRDLFLRGQESLYRITNDGP